MAFWLFLLFTIIGTALWNTILVSIGAVLGTSWEEILAILDVYSTAVCLLIAVGLIILLGLYLNKKRRKS
jgi:membrane protein DedA with SNARE-associated domain